jgi:predicted nucleic acid-binding protein
MLIFWEWGNFYITREMRIYLDNCCYNRPFDDQTQIRIFLEAQAKIYIQSLVVDKKIELVYSYMSVFENNDNPNKKHFKIISDFFLNATQFVSYTEMQQVEKIAEDIAKQNIKNKDALHIASAILSDCEYFVTTDDIILKRYKGDKIIICSPIEFLNFWEKEDA